MDGIFNGTAVKRERVTAKMKCVDFPAELYIRVCEFIGKDVTP